MPRSLPSLLAIGYNQTLDSAGGMVSLPNRIHYHAGFLAIANGVNFGDLSLKAFSKLVFGFKGAVGMILSASMVCFLPSLVVITAFIRYLHVFNPGYHRPTLLIKPIEK